MNPARALVTLTFAAAFSAHIASAQPTPAAPKPTTSDATPAKPVAEAPRARPDARLYPTKTFYLQNSSQPSEANEIQTTIRNLLPPEASIFNVPTQRALVIRASPEDLVLVQKILDDLDRPHKSYRLTYTVTEMDGTKRIGAQHFVMVVASGQKTTLKQDSRVPIATSPPGVGQTQFTYIDVGMDFDATLDVSPNSARLSTSVSDSSAAQDKSDGSLYNPVIRHMTLEGASIITSGKPVMLGSMDIPGSTRHLDVEVVMEPVP